MAKKKKTEEEAPKSLEKEIEVTIPTNKIEEVVYLKKGVNGLIQSVSLSRYKNNPDIYRGYIRVYPEE